jgi:hypothetical protein
VALGVLLAQRGVMLWVNVSSNLRLRSGLRSGLRLGLHGMALDDDEDMLRDVVAGGTVLGVDEAALAQMQAATGSFYAAGLHRQP